MSLKFFHILFVAASSILCEGFSLWCLGEYRASDISGYLITAIVSSLCSLGLVAYGVYFYRKIKNLRLS